MRTKKNTNSRAQDDDSKELSLSQVLRAEHEALGLQGTRKRTVVGLALSGGGIRSATFSLGVLQALAEKKRLASFDYLSTVSGGGYIGSWLSAWIHRQGLDKVQEQLAQSANTVSDGAPASSEPAEVVWLRRYSNYLTPRVGMFSMDTLTLLATWLRNVVLNLIVLLAFFALIFTLPYALIIGLNAAMNYHVALGQAAAWGGMFFVFCIGYNLWHQGLAINRRRNWVISTQGVILTVVVPGILAVMCAVVWWSQSKLDQQAILVTVSYLAALLMVLQVLWMTVEWFSNKHKRQILSDAFIQTLAGGVALVTGALLLIMVSRLCPSEITWAPLHYRMLLLSLGVPVFLAVLGITTTVYTGIVGRAYYERSREWWSRLNAWLITIAFGWAIWCLLSFFSLSLLEWMNASLDGWISLLGTGWLGTLLASLFLRRPESASMKKQLRIEQVLNIAATIFVVGLLVVIAALTQKALLMVVADDGTPAAMAYLWDMFLEKMQSLESLLVYRDEQVPVLVTVIVLLCAVTLLFAWRVDINKFSLHNMYKNRLVRCYLGASNQTKRNEQPFVGLDEEDDFALHELGGPQDRPAPQQPFHIINATLNITQGANLAWQERKAASFVFTPLHCGYSLARTQGDSTPLDGETSTGDDAFRAYRRTTRYAASDQEEKGFTLGMALATSGAAVSPNMGRASMPMLAFVLTLFNIRLGRWSANPAQSRWTSPSPSFGLLALLSELLGLSDERSAYVYLSDGGHFDNLGLYELVRRQCGVILAVDASADEKREMTDLADTIRKCRIDLGVDITFDQLNDFRGDDHQRCSRGFIIGTVRYGAAPPGVLVLIKPSLATRHDEPADVLNYAIQNSTFPHQTTVDQFFDESQFESFRRLGKGIGDACLSVPSILNLLEERAPAPLQKKSDQREEGRSHVTNLIGWMLARPQAERPGRDGSLVDLFIEMLMLTIVFSVLMQLLDLTVFKTFSHFCWTLTSCAANAEEQLDNPAPRLMLDNVFVLLYMVTFILGYKTALGKNNGIWLAVILPVATALCDYAENFLSLSRVHTVTEALAVASLLKFWGFALCSVLLVLMIPCITHAFCERWFRQGKLP
ncbi:patatin-like phospholipase family protein [Pseudomonas sp. NPDC089401]|uniref:patatin-like phospholipase family protein n=1 Tax=Pseudomonas sp. NPDC089401 TaxID=3364462 RepID=UPI003814CF9C